MWDAVKEAIAANENFLFCTHRDPDADGIGSEMALSLALRTLGKSCVVLNPDSLPETLSFLDPGRTVRGFDAVGLEQSLHNLKTELILRARGAKL